MRPIVVLIVLALIGAAFPAGADTPDAAARLDALYAREWQWRLDESPLFASGVGERAGDDRLDRVDEASQRRRLAHLNAVLREIDAIPADGLDDRQAADRAIFREQVASAAANIELRGYLMPLNSDSAFYTDLAFLPQQFTARDATDVRHYLARLRDIPRYFAEQTALLREGIARGMTVPRVVLQGRDKALDSYVDVANPEDHAFYAPLKALPASITADEAETLRADARAAITDAVIPAYCDLRTFLRETYIPKARTTLAAYALPDGKRYYAQQIRDFVTLDLSADAIHDKGLAEVARIRAEMEQVKAKAGFDGDFAAFLSFLRTDPQFYARDAEELLMRAAWVAKRVDAQLPRFFGKLPRQPFGIAPVPDAIAPFYTSGRYVPPSSGSREPGYYWVNTHDLKSRTLYTLPALTLHEAVPGHHLQGALAAEQGEQRPFRRYSYISAYGEGWALYTEHLGVEMGIYRTPYEDFGRLTYEMWRACRLVVDTGVHAKGWTRDRALAFMRDNTALSLHEVETEIDRYISWPGQALSYKMGELKIRELRRRAQDTLGAAFDIRQFHDAVLATGSVPLPLLEAHVDRWIAATSAATAAAAKKAVN